MEPNMIEWRNSDKAILTIHADGRITVAEHLKPTETAAEVLQIMRDQWMSDVQCAKIRELQGRIKRLEEAGDKMADLLLWQSRMDRKTSPSALAWRKAKEAKP
jgi:uncharacterized protein Yka (UPF0111/DUF47 family)